MSTSLTTTRAQLAAADQQTALTAAWTLLDQTATWALDQDGTLDGLAANAAYILALDARDLLDQDADPADHPAPSLSTAEGPHLAELLDVAADRLSAIGAADSDPDTAHRHLRAGLLTGKTASTVRTAAR